VPSRENVLDISAVFLGIGLAFCFLRSLATLVITLIKLCVQSLVRVGFFLLGLEKRKVWVGVALAVVFFAASFPGPILTSSDQPSGGPPGNGWSRTWFHVRGGSQASPLALSALTPSLVKSAYNLPSSGGAGTTIAIVDAYDDPTVINDLSVFSSQYGLTPVSFAEHKMSPPPGANSGWALEISLDVQWAHAIAPNATILLVEASSNSFTDLLNAVSYAANQPNVVAVSMSWGGNDFVGENSFDSYFVKSGVTFFASSGDNGAGVIWPASSPNVVAVGGTTLNLNPDGSFNSETAWSGSSGGVSTIEPEPSFQLAYGVQGLGGHRGVPDVSYNGDPNTGVLVYDSTPYQGGAGWWVVGGTSAGSPQWAAIQALGRSVSNANVYVDAKSAGYGSYFRDITSGSNGLYSAGLGYDLVTGVGSPLTTNFVPAATPSPTVHILLTVGPNQATYTRGQSLILDVTVLNQLNPALNSTLALTVSGPANYYYYDFQPVNVTANAVGDCSFAWTVPNLAGKYVVEVGLVPSQLTAYDVAWLGVT
jgi:subtilase family serine protease